MGLRQDKRSRDRQGAHGPSPRNGAATVRERPWSFAKINGAATLRVCEKTGDCPKRRARARRFINDLREARWTVPRFFHRPLREQFRDCPLINGRQLMEPSTRAGVPIATSRRESASCSLRLA